MTDRPKYHTPKQREALRPRVPAEEKRAMAKALENMRAFPLRPDFQWHEEKPIPPGEWVDIKDRMLPGESMGEAMLRWIKPSEGAD
jgi:hypothetical protein